MPHIQGAAAAIAAAVLLPAGIAQAEDCKVAKYGTLPVEMVDLRPTTQVKINGQETRFILDTGAFFSTMSRATASGLSLKTSPAPPGFYMSGIGGRASADIARVKDFGILGTTFHDIEFLVGGSDLGTGLIGANLLNFADADIDLAHGQFTLMKVTDCNKHALAYWAKDGNYNVADLLTNSNRSVRHAFVSVIINGQRVKALLDTGAPSTLISRRAAERAGIDLTASDVKASYAASGFGAKSYRSWTARVASYSIGTETIQRARMQVMDGELGIGDDVPDMLLVVDFFLAHHLFIANSQHKLYFTYNGGRVFSLSDAPVAHNQPADGGATANAPQSAAEFALRGRAFLSRGEVARALDDLDAAIRLDPGKADYYTARAQARLHDGKAELATADLDSALKIAPEDLDALLMRAELNLHRKDRAAAARDVAAAQAIATAGSRQARTLAALNIALDQPDRALPLLDDWIRLHAVDSKLGNALNERCWARGLANQALEGGLDDCRKAIRRDGTNPAYLDSLGLIQLRLGHYAEAVDAYAKSAAERPKSAWTRYGLGLARKHNGDTAGGDADIAAAKAINPEIAAQFAKFGL